MDCASRIAVTADPPDGDLARRANEIAAHLQLGHDPQAEVSLVVTRERLELREITARKTGPVFVDFVAGRTATRSRSASLRRDPLLRAVGFKGEEIGVVDATAGLGRDAFLLAAAGCRVRAVERSAVLAAILEDGLSRGLADPCAGPIIRDRLTLIHADARTWLASLCESERPDAVYIDPMFPARSKSALSKKEMQICRLVAGEDLDSKELFEVAAGVARHRVVVKRWLQSPVLAGKADIQYKGQSVRYDVYLLH